MSETLRQVLVLIRTGQVLISAATQELTRDTLPPSVSFKPLGEHRLRDLGRPETVFQLTHPDLPADFTPIHARSASGLRTWPTGLVGRTIERDTGE
jgi:class 3 adenylate cyclase